MSVSPLWRRKNNTLKIKGVAGLVKGREGPRVIMVLCPDPVFSLCEEWGRGQLMQTLPCF